jgi:lysozyme
VTTPLLQPDIEGDEGCVLHAYPDPDSPLAKHLESLELTYVPGDETRFPNLSGAPWTIGWGCTGDGIGPGVVWTPAEAQAALAKRIAAACADLDRNIPWWRNMNGPRQDVAAELSFNLGWPRLSAFKNTLKLTEAGQYVAAGKALLASKAAAELPKRYKRLATQLSTGVRAA